MFIFVCNISNKYHKEYESCGMKNQILNFPSVQSDLNNTKWLMFNSEIFAFIYSI